MTITIDTKTSPFEATLNDFNSVIPNMKEKGYNPLILQAKQINKIYPGVQALSNVDFDLQQGEVQALVGQNGAGKSTFIEIIAGSLKPIL